MQTDPGLMLELAMRMELMLLADAVATTVSKKKTQVTHMEQNKTWREASESEKDLLRKHLEDLWETSEHPKKDVLWNLALDLGSSGTHTEVEEIYSRLIALVK